jgi:PEP-CTERM motif
MKTQIKSASLSVLTILCLTLAVAPAMASTLYDNGPYNGNAHGWEIDLLSSDYVSDSFVVPTGSVIRGLDIVYWDASTTDLLESVSMTLGKSPFGDNFYSGLFAPTNTFLGRNSSGYNLYQADFVFNVSWSGAGFMTLYSACTISCGTGGSTPIYWDENSGIGCTGDDGRGGGCPSTAYYDFGLGSIPSESFTLTGSAPEPSSIMLFGSGILGLGGLLRRRFLG